MTNLLIRDLDPSLSERIQRLSAARGWSVNDTFTRLLEHGLLAMESEVRRSFSEPEVEALSDAITALRAVPQGRMF